MYSSHDVLYIMTTNHIELFDPALTRTGRFDINLRLDYCSVDQIKSIVRYNLGIEIDIDLGIANDKILHDNKITPSDIENICQTETEESDILRNLYALIKKKSLLIEEAKIEEVDI